MTDVVLPLLPHREGPGRWVVKYRLGRPERHQFSGISFRWVQG